jgi:hypothetical protein
MRWFSEPAVGAFGKGTACAKPPKPDPAPFCLFFKDHLLYFLFFSYSLELFLVVRVRFMVWELFILWKEEEVHWRISNSLHRSITEKIKIGRQWKSAKLITKAKVIIKRRKQIQICSIRTEKYRTWEILELFLLIILH